MAYPNHGQTPVAKKDLGEMVVGELCGTIFLMISLIISTSESRFSTFSVNSLPVAVAAFFPALSFGAGVKLPSDVESPSEGAGVTDSSEGGRGSRLWVGRPRGYLRDIRLRLVGMGNHCWFEMHRRSGWRT